MRLNYRKLVLYCVQFYISYNTRNDLFPSKRSGCWKTKSITISIISNCVWSVDATFFVALSLSPSFLLAVFFAYLGILFELLFDYFIWYSHFFFFLRYYAWNGTDFVCTTINVELNQNVCPLWRKKRDDLNYHCYYYWCWIFSF